LLPAALAIRDIGWLLFGRPGRRSDGRRAVWPQARPITLTVTAFPAAPSANQSVRTSPFAIDRATGGNKDLFPGEVQGAPPTSTLCTSISSIEPVIVSRMSSAVAVSPNKRRTRMPAATDRDVLFAVQARPSRPESSFSRGDDHPEKEKPSDSWALGEREKGLEPSTSTLARRRGRVSARNGHVKSAT
jgi:hypothetical protein